MSHFSSTVVKLDLKPHPNAERLSLVVLDDPMQATVVVNTADWKGVDKAVWILPDSVTSEDPVFEWYGFNKRVKTAKLRGVISYGFLVPAKLEWNIGDDVSEDLGVKKYVEPVKMESGHNTVRCPHGGVKYTDIENIRKYPNVFKENDDVVITEKLDGANSRFLIKDGTFYLGSHNQWLADGNSWYKQVAEKYNMEAYIYEENLIIFGETYGRVNKLKYDTTGGEVLFAAFDIFDIGCGSYLKVDDFMDICGDMGLPTVPVIYEGKYPGYDKVLTMAEGQSTIASHIREGVVIKSRLETFDETIGRKILKCISTEYLGR